MTYIEQRTWFGLMLAKNSRLVHRGLKNSNYSATSSQNITLDGGFNRQVVNIYCDSSGTICSKTDKHI